MSKFNKEARRQLHKNAASSLEQVLAATPHKTPTVRPPARTYIQKLCEDTVCCPEDLPEAMNDREKWRERVWDIRATSTTWWWWWWLRKKFSFRENVSYVYKWIEEICEDFTVKTYEEIKVGWLILMAFQNDEGCFMPEV